MVTKYIKSINESPTLGLLTKAGITGICIAMIVYIYRPASENSNALITSVNEGSQKLIQEVMRQGAERDKAFTASLGTLVEVQQQRDKGFTNSLNDLTAAITEGNRQRMIIESLNAVDRKRVEDRVAEVGLRLDEWHNELKKLALPPSIKEGVKKDE